MHQADDLIIVYANLMYLGCEFRELAVILNCGLIHHYHLESLSKDTGTNEIGLAHCPRLVVQVDGSQLVFHIWHTGVPSVPAWHFCGISVSVTVVIGYF